jgi:hypothetical protein
VAVYRVILGRYSEFKGLRAVYNLRDSDAKFATFSRKSIPAVIVVQVHTIRSLAGSNWQSKPNAPALPAIVTYPSAPDQPTRIDESKWIIQTV